jgi:hypothetical protein
METMVSDGESQKMSIGWRCDSAEQDQMEGINDTRMTTALFQNIYSNDAGRVQTGNLL